MLGRESAQMSQDIASPLTQAARRVAPGRAICEVPCQLGSRYLMMCSYVAKLLWKEWGEEEEKAGEKMCAEMRSSQPTFSRGSLALHTQILKVLKVRLQCMLRRSDGEAVVIFRRRRGRMTKTSKSSHRCAKTRLRASRFQPACSDESKGEVNALRSINRNQRRCKLATHASGSVNKWHPRVLRGRRGQTSQLRRSAGSSFTFTTHAIHQHLQRTSLSPSPFQARVA